MSKIFFLVGLVMSAGCGIDCIDKKTGLSKSSSTMQSSIDHQVFQHEMFCDKTEFSVANGQTLKITNAWVEKGWSYECVNGRAELTPANFLQFVVDAEYSGPAQSEYYLAHDSVSGCCLGGVLRFMISETDSFNLVLRNRKNIFDTLAFHK